MAIATNEQQLIESVPKQLYIGGEWRDGSAGATIKVEDPATEEVLCEVADATVEDGFAALRAAVETQAEFAAMSPMERGEILRRA